ncbi:MAG: Metallo-beta-lactamase [Candidatus Nomurabacteria bacterium GW2011_GWA2_41_25]|uniref:Metallo-beta-lactamase n=1 Tax=Candidatus Nomurabacteria bacterium GW2011_GWA2_41_25 TaxID=1618736 RepID=A0A0G0YTY5_9BACT|nr:MAG: Metallo-beta-lactamase [Candidatus Nomurabacteria bacterium GW2011_GWA2_41_25]
MKKTRLSFSAISVDNKKIPARPDDSGHSSGERKAPFSRRPLGETERKRTAKSSTYQYTKKRYGQNRGSRPFGSKSQYRNSNIGKIPPPEKGIIRIIPLGGVEEVGKNMTAIEIGDDIIVIDAGMHFSTEATPGVDYVIPNTTYLEERKDKVRALIITHAHLDHIGGVPLVLSRIGNPPVYSRNLSILMMRKRQAEFPHLPPMKENIVEKDSVINCGKIKVRFFGVTHTIPDSMGIIMETEHGWIVTPGDYKLDQVDGIVSKEEEKEYSIFDKAKVLLLMTDSTNIENEGFSLPEIKVYQGLENLIRKVSGRMIIAAFASHITRLAFIVKFAESLGKKIAIDGRSMKTNIDVAIEAGLFQPKKGTIIPIEEANNYPPNKMVVLMTGAQGEEFAALNRAANKSNTKFSLHKGDTIILSASIVPGNELQVQKMKDGLTRQGVKIISYRTAGEDFVHATGHGNQEDIKWLHRKTHPKFFVPIHGWHSMLVRHKELAMELGMAEENIVVPDNGSIIEISPDGQKMTARKEKAPSGAMMVDGTSISDTQDVVIRDRVMLAQDGMFVIIALLDQKTGKLKKSPDLISRGFVYLKENQELLRQVRIIIKKSVEDTAAKIPISPGQGGNMVDFDIIKSNLGESISKFLYQKTAKRPLVIPVILSV